MKLFLFGALFSGCILGIAVYTFPLYSLEIILGFIGPLLAGFFTIYFVILATKQNSISVTKMLIKGFFLKMIYYGLYIIIFFKLYSFKPIPFLCSFAGFFLGLHALEAVIINDLSKTGGYPKYKNNN